MTYPVRLSDVLRMLKGLGLKTYGLGFEGPGLGLKG